MSPGQEYTDRANGKESNSRRLGHGCRRTSDPTIWVTSLRKSGRRQKGERQSQESSHCRTPPKSHPNLQLGRWRLVVKDHPSKCHASDERA